MSFRFRLYELNLGSLSLLKKANNLDVIFCGDIFVNIIVIFSPLF